MDFGLSEDQELLRDSAREFLTRECAAGLVRQVAEDENGYPEALYRKIAGMGWTGLLVPERHGGLGLGALEAAVLLMEAGRALLPGPFLDSAVLSTTALRDAGTAEQRNTWLPKLAHGEAIGTIAWLEKSDRLDAAGI